MDEVQSTLAQFQEAFQTFEKDLLEKQDLVIMFQMMEVYNESEFDDTFAQLDQDNDGLVSFDDFRQFIMLSNQPQPLSTDDIAYIQQLYHKNAKKTFSQLQQIADKDGRSEIFSTFFKTVEAGTYYVGQKEFNELLEYHENLIYGGNVNDLDNPLPDRQSQAQQDGMVPMLIDSLNQQDSPDSQLSEVFQILLDNPCPLTMTQVSQLISQFQSKLSQIKMSRQSSQEHSQQLKKELEYSKSEVLEMKEAFELNKKISKGMEEEYTSMQAKYAEMEVKYANVVELSRQNVLLQNQMHGQQAEVARMRQEMVVKDMEARDRGHEQKVMQDKLEELEIELRGFKGQLRQGQPTGPRSRQTLARVTLNNSQRAPQSSFSTRVQPERFQSERESSIVLQDQQDLTEAQQEQYLKHLLQLKQSEKLSSSDKQCLGGVLSEFDKYKQAVFDAMDDQEQLQQEYDEMVQRLEREIQFQKQQVEEGLQQKRSLEGRLGDVQKELEALQMEVMQHEVVSPMRESQFQFQREQSTYRGDSQYQRQTWQRGTEMEKFVQQTKYEPMDQINEEVFDIEQVEVVKEVVKEVMVPVEVIKEVNREVEVIKEVEVVREVEVIKEVMVEVIKQVDVEVVKEVEVIKEVIREVEVIKEVEVLVPVEVVKEVQVVREVTVEVIKEVEVVREVEVLKEVLVDVIKEVVVIKEVIQEVQVIQQVEVPYEVIKYIETTGTKPDSIDAYTTTQVPTLNVQTNTYIMQSDQASGTCVVLSDQHTETAVQGIHQHTSTEVFMVDAVTSDQIQTQEQGVVTQVETMSVMTETVCQEVRDEGTESQSVQQTSEVSHVSEAAKGSEVKQSKPESDSEEDEHGDIVVSLPGTKLGTSSKLFDEVFDSSPNPPNRDPSMATPQRQSQIKSLMTRSTQLLKQQRATHLQSRQTMLQQLNKDFDFLCLKRPDHKYFKVVNSILTDFQAQSEQQIYTDNIQEFDNSMKAKDLVIILTSKSIFFFSKKCEFIKQVQLSKCEEVVLIKTNSTVMQLGITGSKAMLIQTFRRTDLTVFLLAQRENMGLKTNICRSREVNMEMRSGRHQEFQFDKAALQSKDTKQKTLLKHLQLNNFANSVKSGYLEKQEWTWIGFQKWEEKFCVLTNVGLLWYANPLDPPQDLFPVLDCEISYVKRGDVDYTQGYESIRFVYALKKCTFRCLSKTDYEAWFKAIKDLQVQSMEKRKEMKINQDEEELRLTRIAKGMGVKIT